MNIYILSTNKNTDRIEYSKAFQENNVNVLYVSKGSSAIEKQLNAVTSTENKPDFVIIDGALKKDDETSFRKSFAKAIHNFENTIQEKPWQKSNKKSKTHPEKVNLENIEKTVGEDQPSSHKDGIKYIKKKTHIFKIDVEEKTSYTFMYNQVKIIVVAKGFATASLSLLLDKSTEAFVLGGEKYPDGYKITEELYVPLTFWQKHLPQKNDTASEKIRKSVLILAVAVFVVATGFLINEVFIKSAVNSSVQSEIQNIFYQEETDPVTGKVVVTKNWDKLKKTNKDIVGWIKINHTNIDYPLLYCKTDTSSSQYYLYRNYKKEYSDFGSIFLDHRSTEGMKSKNVIIHGHNMGDGSMFSDIDKYGLTYTGDLDFYKKSPTIEINTPDGNTETYKIFSVFKSNVDHLQGEYFDFYCNEFESNSQFLNYVYNLQIRSLIKTPVKVNEKDRLLTLVTCSYTMDNFRMVVVARKCREGESKKVNVSKASIPSTSLWPECYYEKFGRTRPSVSTFKTEYEKGNITWYDGKYKEDGSEELPSSYDVEIPETEKPTTRYLTVQFYSQGKIVSQKQVKSGASVTPPSIKTTFEKDGYKYTFVKWNYKGSSPSYIVKNTIATAVYSKEKIKEKATQPTKQPTKATKPTKATQPTTPATTEPVTEETTEPQETPTEQEE